MAYEKRGTLREVFGVLGLVFGIFFLIGAVFVVVGWFSWRSAQDFAAHGVDTMATVEKKWESTRECKDSNSNITRTCTDFNVGYAYEVAGKTWHDSATTGYEVWAGLEEGGQIKVRYLPDDPGDSVTSFSRDTVDASGGLDVLAWVFGGLGGVFVLLGGGGLGFLLRRATAGARLRETGTARGAVVVAQEETNVTVNDRRLWRIIWTDDTGAKGKSRGRKREDLPQAGTRITIYADPDGKLPSVWEGDSGTR